MRGLGVVFGLLAAAGLVFGAPSPAQSAEPHQTATHTAASPWDFSFTPYLWALNMDFNVTIEGINGSGYASTLEIIEQADKLYGFEGILEARRGPLSLFVIGDYLYGTFSDKFVGVRTRSVNVVPTRRLDVNVTARAEIDAAVDVELEQTILDFGATYELFKWPKGRVASFKDTAPSAGGYTALDAVFGGRYIAFDAATDLRLNVNFDIGIEATFSRVFRPSKKTFTRQIGGQRQVFINISDREEWVDPFVGLRLRSRSQSGWEWWLRGDVGGFGVASDFAWQLIGGLGKEWESRHGTMAWMLGYRVLDTDYSNGSGDNAFLYDVLIHGPVAGLSFRF